MIINLLLNRADDKQKLTLYKIVIYLKPLSAEIYDLIGNIYFDRKEFDNSLKYYNTAIKHNPKYFESYRNIARVYLELGDYINAEAYFNKAYNLERNNFKPTDKENKTTVFKIEHDIEQIKFLIKEDYIKRDYLKYIEVYRKILQENTRDGIFISLNKEEYSLINQNIFIYQIKEFKTVVSNTHDFITLKNQFKNNNPNHLYFDNFLNQEVLTELYNFAILSTVWHGDKKTGGYIGSYIDDGFNNQIIYKIAEELKLLIPEIFGDLSLIYVWAYKYNSEYSGIAPHADKALVNVNFWITPDEANLDKESGGLIIYSVKPPDDWDFYNYNSSTDKIESFLLENKAKEIVIPYKQNRCVIFDSSLFHKSDEYNFKSGYENKRINITMLFGHKN